MSDTSDLVADGVVVDQPGWRDERFAHYEKHRFLGRLNLHAGTPPSQFVVYNRVTDSFFYYPDARRGFLSLRETLTAYLSALEFEVIVYFNLSEGFQFADPAMRTIFDELMREPQDDPAPATRQPSRRNRKPLDRLEQPAEQSPPDLTIGTPIQLVSRIGRMLRQSGHAPGDAGFRRCAVIIERFQNLLAGSADTYQLIDEIQSWAGITNGNVSILVVDVAELQTLQPDSPISLIVGRHRSGLRLVEIGLPDRDEVGRLFTLVEKVGLNAAFAEEQEAEMITISEAQRRDLIARLEGSDIVTLHSYLRTCVSRGIGELNLRTLRTIITRTTDVWPELLGRRGLAKIEQVLRARVRGQDFVLDSVLRRFQALNDDLNYQQQTGLVSEKPLAFFFFAGPTGVGKTEIFRALAEALPEVRTRKFNMPEYREIHSVARFFGSPPGYGGSKRGELGSFLLENPAAIVLFDEIEKAHPGLWRNFLTILEGGLTTGDGEQVDLSQVIFIFTSNAGSDSLAPIRSSMADDEQERLREENRKLVVEALRAAYAPTELIGRLIEMIIPFNQMDEEVVEDIIRMRFRDLEQRFGGVFDSSVTSYLIDLFLDQERLGARPVTQHIDNALKNDVVERLRKRGLPRFLPSPRTLIYKDTHRRTRFTEMPTPPSAVYERTRSAVPRALPPPPVDASTPQALRTTLSPRVVAVLAFDAAGVYQRCCAGVLVTPDGRVLTNRDAILGAHQLIVFGENGQLTYEVRIGQGDRDYDLALLLPSKPLPAPTPFLTPANSGAVDVDTPVVCFGFPGLIYNAAVAQPNYLQPVRSEDGHIGARQDLDYLFLIRGFTISDGFFGGPLIHNVDGRWIGVMFQRSNIGTSYAIMSNAIRDFLRQAGIEPW